MHSASARSVNERRLPSDRVKVTALTVPQFGVGNDRHSALLALPWINFVIDNCLLTCPAGVCDCSDDGFVPIECLGLVVTSTACVDNSILKYFVGFLQMLDLR